MSVNTIRERDCSRWGFHLVPIPRTFLSLRVLLNCPPSRIGVTFRSLFSHVYTYRKRWPWIIHSVVSSVFWNIFINAPAPGFFTQRYVFPRCSRAHISACRRKLFPIYFPITNNAAITSNSLRIIDVEVASQSLCEHAFSIPILLWIWTNCFPKWLN